MAEYHNKFEQAEEVLTAAESNYVHWKQKVKESKEEVEGELDTSVPCLDPPQEVWLVMLKKFINSLKEELEKVEVEKKQTLTEGKNFHAQFV